MEHNDETVKFFDRYLKEKFEMHNLDRSTLTTCPTKTSHDNTPLSLIENF